ncbi:MAG: hypothetical protein M1404_07470 [Acidobacteria bacterium]|nr:hypothetical protein [Acidobacteriota bacterium]
METTDPNVKRSVSVTVFQDAIDAGKQVTLSVADPQSKRRWPFAIKVYNQFPGLRLDWELENSSEKELNLLHVKVIASWLRSSHGPVSSARVLINGDKRERQRTT